MTQIIPYFKKYSKKNFQITLPYKFKTLRQKSHSSLAGGMNATNLWYNVPIHSYLRQEVSEVTPLEI
ncbi:hypothetical protein [Helicobacter suis]|uniref:hypothetical protein n=1 Tax=Helicobacter suis TaxID=104628 RepID=UPI002491540E|nr:hypothetical protein [Helicobacter suis]